jgi:acetyl-CoA synthetase
VDEWARTHPNKKALCWVNDQGEHIDFTFKDMKEKSDAAADIKAIVCVGESSTMRFPNALP